MPITLGEAIDPADFINNSEKNATPANDAGRVPKLESDARLHKNFMPEKALVRAYKSGSTQVTTTSYVKVTFASESYDVGGDFASSTFAAPRDGYYRVAVGVAGPSGGSGYGLLHLAAYINGSIFSRCVSSKPSSSSPDAGGGFHDVVYLSASDTLDIYAKHQGDAFTFNTGEAETFIVIEEV